MAGVAVACSIVLSACADTGGGSTSRYLSDTHENRDCPGAFTPFSTVCYDKTSTANGPISTDTTRSEEILAGLEGMDRCQQIGVPVPGTPGELTVTFTTQLLGGTYMPKNCGAAWIEDSMGQYVRTVEMWAAERAQSITMWYPRACHMDATVTSPDVITSGTLDKHQTHSRKWDGKDFRGAVAPDGKYTLWLQVTESEFVPEGPYIMIPFEKGAAAWEAMPTPIPGFTEIKLSYKPGAAAPAGAVQP
ncbi:MAG TPA: hypothetical protein VJR89_09055 [Polyangiales bacterium]|nr:hypothetical protein [Polyangiales bacterium]